jgi:crotonobetainyl-CoA:carnitine CoA-transferase CaiB-like acyl-CoA transferase
MAAATGTALRQVGRGHPRPASERLSHDDLKQEAWRLAKTVDGSADVNAALAAATAVLLGLTVRDATGEGQAITTTMLCSNIHANSDEAIDQKDRPAMHRPDEGLFGIGPAYRLYAAAEGWVFLACVQRKEWDVFCRAIDRTDLILAWDTASASDGESAGELVARLEELFRSKSAAAWEDLVLNLGVPLVAVNLLDPGNASLADDDLREQSLMVSVRNEKYGEYWRHGPLQQFAGSHAVLGSWEPAAGHTWSVLAELGYTDHEINRLVDSHIIELGGT